MCMKMQRKAKTKQKHSPNSCSYEQKISWKHLNDSLVFPMKCIYVEIASCSIRDRHFYQKPTSE